jgi:Cytochrome P450
MQWFSALIPSYPEIQARAHDELDRVVGLNRLPTIEDEQDLPYLKAIIKVCTIAFIDLEQRMMIYRKSNVVTIRSG